MTSDNNTPARERPHLYLITPPRLEDENAFLKTLETVLSTGMVTALQLRLKADDGAAPDLATMTRLGAAIAPMTRSTDTALIINDSAEVAAETGADGVHLGQTDGSIKTARDLLGPDVIIGATCHDSRHLAMQAGEAGADYVAFGAFYPTTTKAAPTVADPAILTWWQELMELPCVAIGGITLDNAAPLIRAGADFLAVSAGIWQHTDGPAAAVEAFDRLLTDTFAAEG